MKKKFLPFINRRFAHIVGDGNFTASVHLEFLLKAEEYWADGKYTDDLEPHVDAALQLLENQSAKFDQLSDPQKDNKVKITWIKSCGIDTEDFDRADGCTIDGVELDTAEQEYEMTMLQKASFKIDDEKIRTGTYSREEQVAIGMMRCDKQLSEWWTKNILLFYKASVGPNIPAINGLTAPFTWDALNTTTNIPAANYDVKIVASLIKQMQLNQVDNGFFVNSGNLFEAWTNAGLNAGNLDGKGDDLRLKQIKLAFDMWNFAKAGLTEDMFLVDKAAVALKTFCRYSDKPETLGGTIQQTRYRMKSNILPGVYWDVVYTLKCLDGHDYHIFELRTQGGLFLNPEPCPITIAETEYTPTGVYSFTRTP